MSFNVGTEFPDTLRMMNLALGRVTSEIAARSANIAWRQEYCPRHPAEILAAGSGPALDVDGGPDAFRRSYVAALEEMAEQILKAAVMPCFLDISYVTTTGCDWAMVRPQWALLKLDILETL